MKLKLVFVFLLLIPIMLAERAYVGGVEPAVDSHLAMEQFKNPSLETDTAGRNLRGFNPFPYVYTMWSVFGVWFVYPNVKGFVNEKIVL